MATKGEKEKRKKIPIYLYVCYLSLPHLCFSFGNQSPFIDKSIVVYPHSANNLECLEANLAHFLHLQHLKVENGTVVSPSNVRLVVSAKVLLLKKQY